MKLGLKKATCRVLAVSVLALSFQSAQAGLIGADAAAPPAVPERTLLLSALERGEVVAQLQAAGVDPQAARERIGTMSDAEVQAMAQDIQTAPIGAMSTWGWVAIVVVIGLIWYYGFRK
jgi:hypothetical protein